MKMDHLAIIFKSQMIFKKTPSTADAEGIPIVLINLLIKKTYLEFKEKSNNKLT